MNDLSLCNFRFNAISLVAFVFRGGHYISEGIMAGRMGNAITLIPKKRKEKKKTKCNSVAKPWERELGKHGPITRSNLCDLSNQTVSGRSKDFDDQIRQQFQQQKVSSGLQLLRTCTEMYFNSLPFFVILSVFHKLHLMFVQSRQVKNFRINRILIGSS